MVATIKDDHIKLEYDSDMELEQMALSFTKFIRNARFRARGGWDGSVSYLRNDRLPLGMWAEIKTVAKKFDLPIKFINSGHLVDRSISLHEVHDFCTGLMAGHKAIKPYAYQVEAVYKLARYPRSMADLSTSSGKTLIVYMLINYLKSKGHCNKFLIVCPDADLVMQMYGDFSDYSSHLNNKLSLCMVHGGSSLKDISEYDVSIGNFQTLSKRDQAFFNGVDCFIGDEAHRCKNKSIKDIIKKCTGATLRRHGVSGTLRNDNSADYYDLIANIGPVVKRVSKKDLMVSGKATAVKSNILVLDYLSLERREHLANLKDKGELTGSQIYEIECSYVRESKARLAFLIKLIRGLKGNVLVLFRDVKGGYGKQIARLLKQHSDKYVYYVDGSTKKKARNMYNKQLEAGAGRVIVANWVIYSTGKSIKNLHHVVTAEGMKSEEQVSQAIGRLMRLHESKEEAIWWDIADDFSVDNDNYKNKNSLMYQLDARRRIYSREKIPTNQRTIKLS